MLGVGDDELNEAPTPWRRSSQLRKNLMKQLLIFKRVEDIFHRVVGRSSNKKLRSRQGLFAKQPESLTWPYLVC